MPTGAIGFKLESRWKRPSISCRRAPCNRCAENPVRSFERFLVICILLLHALLVGVVAYLNSPVLDELPHLASGMAHWKTGSFEPYRVNPPLVRCIAALPVILAGADSSTLLEWETGPFDRPEFALGRRFVESNGPRTFFLFTLARWACLPFTVLGGYMSYRWSRELYGAAGGLTTLLLWCMCPNLIGWGATICPDAPAAAMGVLASYSFWRWFRDPTWQWAGAAGVCLGLSMLTKSSWILLLGVWPLLWLVTNISLRFSQAARHENVVRTSAIAPSGWKLVAILILGLYVLNLGYGFSGSFRPLGNFTFISRALSGSAVQGDIGNRFGDSMLKTLPIPLPADFVIGVDVQRYDFEVGKWSYLRGEQKRGGWWYYYVYALAVKTPIGSLLLIAAALGARRIARGQTTKRLDELFILAPAVFLLFLVSTQTGFNRYLRYVLPAVPFLFIWAGRAGYFFEASGRDVKWLRWGRGFVLACLIATVSSSLWAWPHSLSYFNEIVGGPRYGHLHLLDANIDWGQDLLHLKRWNERHTDAEPLHLSYFGWVDPRLAGIQARPIPGLLFGGNGEVTVGNLADVLPGWYVVSVNQVMGYRHSESSAPIHNWLMEFEPVGQVGYSLWIYRLSGEDIRAFRARHQLARRD